MLPTPEDSPPLSPVSHTPPQTLRRRVKGYQIYSDEEPCSSGGEEEENTKGPASFAQVAQELDQDTLPISISDRNNLTETFTSIHSWISDSLLPVHTKTVAVPPSSMNSAERAVSSFTLYSELKRKPRKNQNTKQSMKDCKENGNTWAVSLVLVESPSSRSTNLSPSLLRWPR